MLKNGLSVKKVRVYPRLYLFQTLSGPCPQCRIPIPRVISPLVSEKKILRCFYHILAWPPFLSYDQNVANKFSVSLPMKALYENLALIGPVALLVSEKNIFLVFLYIYLCKTIDPWSRAILNPRATI